MDEKSLETLELGKILDRLAGHAHFSGSKDLARGLKPSPEREEATRRLAATSEARRLLENKKDHTIGGAHDVRPEVAEAARGSSMEPSAILRLKDTLIAARTQRRFLEDQEEDHPELGRVAERLTVPDGLIDRISQVLDERGEVKDSASKELARIRRQQKVVHDRLMAKMEGYLADANVLPMLQETIVTQREGRYVLPLRAEYKGQLEAIVHDRSSSGATLFVEPTAVVELNNEVRELELAEREEVHRILLELAGRIGESRQEIDSTVGALAELDLHLAKARYADELGAVAPELAPEPSRSESGAVKTRFQLLGARHPLLAPDDVVPIDLEMDEQTRALVITGPNTGGKTVALKTAGLLTLMALAGLHIPVEKASALSSFRSVFADIGDEQSIEQSLSTFSAHVANIIRILDGADERSLVLLDELGAGTDPQEGASLAMAILKELLDRGATTLVATHYPELKTYAHATPGARNASVQFDLDTLEPTYHLTVGLPGRSNALDIAARLGLPEQIVEAARSQLSPEELEADRLLDEIHKQREAARQAQEAAEAAREQAEGLRSELAQRLEAIEDERRATLKEAREEGAAELEELREEITSLRQRLARVGQPLEAVEEVAEAAAELEESLEEPVRRAPPEFAGQAEPVRAGDRVLVRSLDSEGTVAELGESEAEVQVGNLRVRAKLEELVPVDPQPAADRAEDEKAPMRGVTTPDVESPPMEIDLRGRTAEEALAELDRRLDAAFMAGLPYLRVIHGKGTGRLREAIRGALPEYSYVEEFEGGGRREGGEGVTMVTLARR